MNFKDYFEAENLIVKDICVEIEELPLEKHEEILLEFADAELVNFIRGIVQRFANQVLAPTQPSAELKKEDGLKKFRVSLRMPSSRRKTALGHFMPHTVYLYATSRSEAKQRALEQIRNKLEPVENDETKRVPKDNYLKKVPKKYFDLRAEKVETWKDFVKILKHVANRRGDLTPLDYFDENDFKILLKRTQAKSFEKDVKKLTPAEQKLLKRFYFHMAQSPWLSVDVYRSLDPQMSQKMNLIGTKKFGREREVGEEEGEWMPPTTPDWNYWSIYEPKTPEEEQELLNKIHNIRDVFEAAKRYGIRPRELKQVRDALFDAEDQHIELEKKLFRYMQKRIGLSYRNRIFQESDYRDPKLAKYVNWDELTKDLLASREPYAEAFPYYGESDEAAQWLWDFYKKGVPKTKTPLQKLIETFKHLLDYRARNKNEQVPFDD